LEAPQPDRETTCRRLGITSPILPCCRSRKTMW